MGRKNVMKHLYRLIMLIFATIVLSGCEPQQTKEEVQQACIDDYVEKNLPELTYDVKDKYDTTEETYQEIINLYVWKYNRELKILVIFNSYTGSDEEEEALEIECEKYRGILQTNFTDALIHILDTSNEEIHEKFNEIKEAIIHEGFNHIVEIEDERKQQNYQQMFLKCSTKFMREMYYTLYPEEMLQGALENIDQLEEEEMERTKIFLQEIGEEEILAKLDQSDELNGNAGGIDLGDPEESDDDDHEEEKEVEKEESEEEKKELPYDPYDVYDYWDPEDFYYDWEDDFDGYEDAEDYWYDAWDEIE